MFFWLAISLGWTQEAVTSVYKALEKAQYAPKQLELSAIQGMLTSVDEQSGLTGSQVLSQAEY
jgi:hypothetical protein